MKDETKTASYNWCTMAAELYGECGPIGEFVEVTKCAICDYGGNRHAEGTPEEMIKRQKNFNIQTQLVATETNGVKVEGADVLAAYSAWDD